MGAWRSHDRAVEPPAAASPCNPFPCMHQVWQAAEDLAPVFAQIDRTVAANLKKVQAAFKENRIGPHHFQGSTGYGHGDWGREALDNVREQPPSPHSFTTPVRMLHQLPLSLSHAHT